MNLNLIECFLTLADTLSFTEAARRLSVTQPSISRQIRLLEEELNTVLFIRNRRTVRLSNEGKELRASLAPLLDEMRRAFAATVEKSQSVEGPLTFACLPEIGQYFFARLLIEFQEAYPLVDLHIRYLLHPEIVEGIGSGEIDFGVLSSPVISESIRSYKLMDERSVLVTRAQNREAFDIEKAHVVGYSRYDELLQSFLKSQSQKGQLRKVHRFSSANSHRTMIELLLSRDCYAVLPTFSIQEQLNKKKLRIVSDRELTSTFYLLHLDSGAVAHRNGIFRKFLLERCRASHLD